MVIVSDPIEFPLSVVVWRLVTPRLEIKQVELTNALSVTRVLPDREENVTTTS